MLLPRHLEIIYEINRRLLDAVRARFPGDEGRVARVSLIEEGPTKHVRMANLAIVGSHSTNGVAAIHSELLRTTTVKDLAEMFPERFSNKTNGVTPRRWLLLANPALASTITEAIGDGWITDLAQLSKLKPLADDKAFATPSARPSARPRCSLPTGSRRHPGRPWIPTPSSIARSSASTNTSGNCSTPCASSCSTTGCGRIRTSKMPPRTFFFAGKAAPAYHLAKLIIKFINNLAGTIDGDPAVRGRLKVVFLPEYDVTLAERLIPASDVSNQISTAGYEASGTSNMKFMMNGALTIGTRDGATIEMAEEAGEENFFLFGLTAEQVARQPRLVQPALALRTRAGNPRGAGSDFLGPFQPQRAGHFRAAARRAADRTGDSLHAPGGPEVLPGGGPAAGRTVCRPGRLGAQGHPECGRLRKVLQRPHHRRVRGLTSGTRSRARCPNGALRIAKKGSPMAISPLAGQPAPKAMLVDVARLEREYFERRPDMGDPNQLVSFGTSGHRGSSLSGTFTEAHILAITQAICDYRRGQGTDGPLYMGMVIRRGARVAPLQDLLNLGADARMNVPGRVEGNWRWRSTEAMQSARSLRMAS